VLFSYTSSAPVTSHQPPASQQYFSLTINQPQPPATGQPNEAEEGEGGEQEQPDDDGETTCASFVLHKNMPE
jgi:hypothetical protein